jgi:hypothetical protein
LRKKWGILIKKESESRVFTGLEIPRDYNTEKVEKAIQKAANQLSDDTEYEEGHPA